MCHVWPLGLVGWVGYVRCYSPLHTSHFAPLGLVGGGWEQVFSTTRHQAGMAGSSWMHPPWEDIVVPFASV